MIEITRQLRPLSLVWLLLLPPSVSAADLVRVSVHTNGSQGFGQHQNVSISGDGRFVVFDTGSVFDPDDEEYTDIYLRDRDVDEDGVYDEPGAVATLIVSISVDGVFANFHSYKPSISDNGRFVSFDSRANNLTSDYFDPTTGAQIHVLDRDVNRNGVFYEVDMFGKPNDIALMLASPRYSDRTRASDRSSYDSVMADNGRVFFASTSTNLVSDDANDRTQDVFLWDPDSDSDWIPSLPSALVTRVSDAATPPWTGQPWGISGFPSISRDGRFVAYDSDAEDVVDARLRFCEDLETDVCVKDIFILDRDVDGDGVYYETGDFVTVQITVSPSREAADGESRFPDLSADGRFVVFTSYASNLVAGEPADSHCYVHDRDVDGDGIYDESYSEVGSTKTVLVSVSSDGTLANSHCSYPSISGNGRFVVFNSLADNLVEGDTNGYRDTFVHDRDADRDGIFDEPGAIETARLSVSPGGAQSIGHSELRTDISADGRYIAFQSDARLLLPEDTNHVNDIYVADNPFFYDPDGDGVEEEEEQGPNGDDPGWDGDGDKVPDSEQDNVASMHNYDGDAYVTLAVPPATSLAACESPDVPAARPPRHVEIPYGVFEFTVEGVEPGGEVTVDLHLPEALVGEEGETFTYWMYGRTHDQSQPHWYAFGYDDATVTGAQIDALDPSIVHLYFVDGERGDEDLAANGVIIDPGAPALVPEPTATILAAAALTGLAVIRATRRRR